MHFISISWTIFQSFLLGWMGLAVIVFFILLRVTAPYGRHSSVKWGPQVPNRLGWIIMELPVLLILWIILAPYFKDISLSAWLMISLFSFHYVYRSLVFPFRLHTHGKKMPLVIVGSAIFFNIINGCSMGYYFTRFAVYTDAWLKNPQFIVGCFIFFTGLLINWKADSRLIALRKPSETGYMIPRGGLFEKISCPNLFGELIEWLGFAMLCNNLPALAFFVWTAANLIPRALSHHRWYQEKFSDYPGNRKAIIPYII
ncbi:MAG: DUF1295 domain-containing protein [Terrimonas sp.]|nr:DUF1295 domain-containing protein [Terrimonas sp.]